jgi:ABC-2 type transport system ATP-binding protein
MSMPEPVEPQSCGAITVQGLSKRFRGRPAIDGLSLTVKPGDICGLAGANGGGKSTTIRLLAGLMIPDEGEGSILGHDLIRAAHLIRQKVGYLAQHGGLRRPACIAHEQLRAFGLADFASVAVGELSGGWLRQVQLAAALIHRPRLLLLDEPTVGLDPAARHAIWRTLSGLAIQGTAIVLSTHDLLEAGRCSQVLLLSHGRVRARGSPVEVLGEIEAGTLIVNGPDTLGLAELLDRSLVMAADPIGSDIRLVVAFDRMQEVKALLRGRGYQSTPDSLTLEDAALVVAHRARSGSRDLES